MTIIWTGTANFTNGDPEVNVTDGPALNEFNCTPGSMLIVDGAAYFVAERTSLSSFTMSRDFDGFTAEDLAFEISPVTQNTTSMATLAAVLAEVRASLNVLDRNSQGLFFYHIGVTGDADPGPGNLALNHADPSQATEIYIDNLDANTAHRSVVQLLARFAVGTTIRLRSLASTAYYEFDITGTSVDQDGWYKATLAYAGHDGVIGNGEAVALSWVRSGEGLDVDGQGDLAGRAAFDDEAGGFIYMSNEGDITTLYVKNSATTADWSDGFLLTGPRGFMGWSPRLAVASDGVRRVFQISGWVGGGGDAPTVGVGQYVGSAGLVANVANGVDIRGINGASAYEVAVAAGFVGDVNAWLASLVGASAYQVAVANGFAGTEAEWLASLNGADGTDPGALYNWDDGTADEDPGTGNIRADSADLSTATMLIVSKTGRTGDDLSDFLLGLAASTNALKGNVTLTSSGGNAQAIVGVTGVSDETDYVKILLKSGSQSGATGFVGTTATSLQFTPAGDQGGSASEELLVDQRVLGIFQSRSAGSAIFLGGAGSALHDAFMSLDYVDVDNASNLDASVSGILRPTEALDQDASATPGGGTSATYNATFYSRSWAIDNDKTVKAIGLYSNVAATFQLKIIERTSPTTGDVIYSEAFAHTGGGWQDFTLSVPQVIPSAGDFYPGVFGSSVSGLVQNPSIARTGLGSGVNAVGSGLSSVDSTNNCPALRVTYAGDPDDLNVSSVAVESSQEPQAMRLVALVKTDGVDGTDINFTVSRDGGSSWAAAPMTYLYDQPGGFEVWASEDVDVSGQGAGGFVQWSVSTENNVAFELSGVAVWGLVP